MNSLFYLFDPYTPKFLKKFSKINMSSIVYLSTFSRLQWLPFILRANKVRITVQNVKKARTKKLSKYNVCEKLPFNVAAIFGPKEYTNLPQIV